MTEVDSHGKSASEPDPPEVPEIERRLLLRPLQWVGVPLLALPALLALLGVFGQREGAGRSEIDGLELRVRWPERTRYQMGSRLEAEVRNGSGAALDTVWVRVDESYLSGFADVSFVPAEDEAYAVSLAGIAAGERRLVRADLTAERYGRHAGRVVATGGGPDTVAVAVSTLIFP
ncbi:MAG: hypothetical protein ABR599_01915 [Gemmatimonadota bacterium]